MEQSSPARVYAGLIGALLVIAGIVGFFYNADFTSNAADRDAVLGIFDVNGWTNVFSIVIGLIGLVCFMAGAYVSRYYAIAMGFLFTIIAVWGFIIGSGDSILSIMPVNTAGSFLDLAIALLGLWAARMPVTTAVVLASGLLVFLIPGATAKEHHGQTTVDKGRAGFDSAGCRNCHTLKESGSLGTIGPNLNEVKPDKTRVMAAIKNGGLGTGAMPAGLAKGRQAADISAYVAYASGGNPPPVAGGPPGKAIFTQNCGSCHTLADAGTSGNVGPVLDQIKPNKALVLATIKAGPGAMPPNLVSGKDAQEVADYVSSVAGKK